MAGASSFSYTASKFTDPPCPSGLVPKGMTTKHSGSRLSRGRSWASDSRGTAQVYGHGSPRRAVLARGSDRGKVPGLQVVLRRDDQLDRRRRIARLGVRLGGERLTRLQPPLDLVRPVRDPYDDAVAKLLIRGAVRTAELDLQDLIEVRRRRLDEVCQERRIALAEAQVPERPLLGALPGAEPPVVNGLLDLEAHVARDLAAAALEVASEERSAEGRPRRASGRARVELVDREGLGLEREDRVQAEMGDEVAVHASGLSAHAQNDLEVMR